MIPSPKLDDREFDDIVAEALRLIPRYAPEWTNHNPSDPGITLIELAAWMTDLILYRLNRVPEKNYIAFLNLLGIRLRAPHAARALLQFGLVDGASRQLVPAGTQVSTPQGSDEDTIVFETARDLVVTGHRIKHCFSSFDQTYSENTAFLGGARTDGFEVFGGAERVDRFLYLSDPRLAGCGEASILRVFLGCPERGGRDLARLLEWQYWSGDRWRDLEPAALEVDRGEVCFLGPLGFEPTRVFDLEGLWLRGRLAEVVRPEDTEIDTIRVRVEVAGEGVAPDRALVNLDTEAFIFLDLGKNIYPLGKEPKVDCVFYLACANVVRTPDAEVVIEVQLADPGVIAKPAASEDLTLAWEYWDGRRWRQIGRSGPRGTRPGGGDHGFDDTTLGFTRSGAVRFRLPRDLEPVKVAGETQRWLRVRLEAGNYGVAGSYTLESDRWIFRDDRPLRPPALRHVAFRAREEYRDVRHVVAFNDFTYTDVTEPARTEFSIFQPFAPQADESPAIYLGFADRLPHEMHGLYFHMAEELGQRSLPADEAEIGTSELAIYNAARRAAWEHEQRVVWEHWDGAAWVPLAVADGTQGFTSSGFVDFVAPEDWQRSRRFTEEAYWLRARLEMGGYVRQPRVVRVLANVVEAHNHATIRGEILGSSDGTPAQSYQLLHGPLLEGEVIRVLEPQPPSAGELAELGGDEALEVVDHTSQTCWVRWQRIDSFFESSERSRHYTIDHQTGRVTFGDGRRGMIPPQGLNGIVATSYRVGGGAAGNVNPGTLTSLSRALAYIDHVSNPVAAAGGSDRETVEEAKERAPYTIKSRDRAVTAEDFEMLALRASTSLARARCVPDRAMRGAVTLAVVPKGPTGPDDLDRRLVPSNEILRYVKRYLDERRLIGTVLHVVKPRYRELSLKVSLLRRTIGSSDRLRREIELRLRRHLHALVGGRDGQGWPFGRAVLKTELIHLVEEVPGVEGVDAVAMLDEARNVHVEQIRVDPDELPFLVHVHIVEKVRDEIL